MMPQNPQMQQILQIPPEQAWDEILTKGAMNDIVVCTGELANSIPRRLVFNMRQVAQNKGLVLDRLYIPADTYPDFDLFSPPHNMPPMMQMPIIPLFGFVTIPTELLNQQGKILTLYKNKGLAIPEGRNSLVIAVGQTGNVLIGACNILN